MKETERERLLEMGGELEETPLKNRVIHNQPRGDVAHTTGGRGSIVFDRTAALVGRASNGLLLLQLVQVVFLIEESYFWRKSERP